MGMAALSIDVLLPAFPDLRREFGLAPDATEISRVITAFFFGLAVGQLVYGPLSDRFGRSVRSSRAASSGASAPPARARWRWRWCATRTRVTAWPERCRM
jgi:MFS family permease